MSLQKRLLFGFVLALMAQAFAGLLLQRNNAAFRAAQDHVAHGHEVTEALQQFLASAEDAETCAWRVASPAVRPGSAAL